MSTNCARVSRGNWYWTPSVQKLFEHYVSVEVDYPRRHGKSIPEGSSSHARL